MIHQMLVAGAACALLAATGHATLANGAMSNLAPTKKYVCEGADAGGHGGRCIEHLFKGLDLPNCQAACAPPPPPVSFSCTGATAVATKKVCAFVSQWNQAAQGDKPSLVCTPEEQCTIGGTKLGANSENGRVTDFGFQGDATMTNVLLRDNWGNLTTDHDRGGLMEIGRAGSLVGTNITFRNGLVRVDGGGCVYTAGNFACIDCTFDKCITTKGFGGGIESGGGGTLNLLRPTFTESACALGENCGSGCSCDGDDRRGQGMNASLCIGCTCKKVDGVGFYCDSN